MKNSIYYFISGIIAFAFGIFIIVNPSAVINIAAFLFSIVLFLRGARTLFNTIRFDRVATKTNVHGVEINMDWRKNVRNTMFLNSAISLLVGLASLIVSIVALIKGSSAIMKIVVYIVASGFLVSAVAGALENRRMKTWEGLGDAIGEKTIFHLVVALVLFIFPSLVGNVLMNILGALVVAFGVLYFAWGVYIFKAEKRVKDVKNRDVEDVSWKDVDKG